MTVRTFSPRSIIPSSSIARSDRLDAGTCDNAPLPRPDDGATLILLTRRYRNTPHHEQRLYLAPSDATPADKIDFTSRQKIEDTWEMGRKDGQAFIEKYSPT